MAEAAATAARAVTAKAASTETLVLPMTIERLPLELKQPPADDPGVPELVERLRDEIARNGPITFARFMERALYEPGLGYYVTSGDRTTPSGDFVTAPELHPIFGWAIANQVDEMWRWLGEPGDFVLREYGAGRGTLGRAVGEGLAQIGSALATRLKYEPVEVAARQATHVSEAAFTGVVLANEFLDALPVHRVIGASGRLRELYVGWSEGRFVELVGDPSDERLVAWYIDGDRLANGQRAEVCLKLGEWLASVAAVLLRGYVLLIDYGFPRSELLSPSRATGTIRAFRGQHVSSDVLSGVGRQDITAHIDLDALESEARAAGFEVLGRTTQAEFLMGSGLDDIYQAVRDEADRQWEAATLLRSAVRLLLDPRQMGSYAVVLLGRGVEPGPEPLRGLAFRTAGRA